MGATTDAAMNAAAAACAVAIRPADGNSDIAVVRELFLEYAAGLGFSLCFQDFDAELAGLPGDYAPPAGGLWLAEIDGAAAGCVGLRPLEPGICEIKRLYLRPSARGLGLGRRMAETVLAAAQRQGYRTMRLDTVDEMVAAQSLYRALGFRERPPYGSHQHPRLRYFELAFAAPSR
jgi:ribosomal protein S18 acetylase RimI-like enzyme